MDSLAEEKKFYDRFWALLSNRNLMMVFEKYGPTAFRRSSVLEGFEAFIDRNEFCGETCLEIGTLNGLTAILLASRFDNVVTIDIVDRPIKYEIVALLGIENIEFITVADNIEKAEFIGGRDFDGAYMDGDHAHDTQSDFALVCRCGNVLLHEHWDAQPEVMALVESLAGNIVCEGKLALWTA